MAHDWQIKNNDKNKQRKSVITQRFYKNANFGKSQQFIIASTPLLQGIYSI